MLWRLVSTQTKYRLLFLFYSSPAVLGIGYPLYRLFVGDRPILWGLLLILAIATMLYFDWLYLPLFDPSGLSIHRGTAGRGRVALTFDDGPNGSTTAAILDVLARHGAHATFFCIGRLAAEQPELLRRMVKEGHAIGNHSQDHRKLAWLSQREVAHQIDAAQESIARAGVPTPVVFRAPHGVKSLYLFGLLRTRGLRLCAWSHDIRDFAMPGAAALVELAKDGLQDGAIVLLHDGGGDRSQTVTALDGILQECRARSLIPVTVPELLSPS